MLALAWSLTALAGPLDLPDPAEMGPYRCVERPLGLENRAELGDRKVSDSPPGPPTWPVGVQSGMVPHASDADLVKAAKGRYVETFPAVGTLATGGVPVIESCQSRATTRDAFSFGCTEALACELLIEVDGKASRLQSRPQAAARFSPVEDAKEALGLLMFYEPDLFLPMTPGELAAWAEQAAGYRAVEPALPWVEIETHPDGFLVRAPRRVTCGCDHDVIRRAYWVAKDGRSCAVAETPLALAVVSGPPVCVD